MGCSRWPLALALLVSAGCAARPRCDGVTCAPACPRNAAPGADGRCVCTAGDVLVLGACVPATVGDAFCGPAARMGAGGCELRRCGGDEQLDLASGACVARAGGAHRPATACIGDLLPALWDGRPECVTPEATCPRGSRREGGSCVAPPRCPPGTLHEGAGCRVVVTSGGRSTGQRVDLGAWAGLALGLDGGPGSPDLCRPLRQAAAAFAVPQGDALVLGIRVAVTAPDQDVSRVSARVETSAGAGRQITPAAEALVSDAVGTLLEALRGLGGESTSASMETLVICALGAS